MFVGDDTGLLKKLHMSFSIEDFIVSEPSKSVSRKKRMAMEQEEAIDEIAEEVKNMEETPVIRHRP